MTESASPRRPSRADRVSSSPWWDVGDRVWRWTMRVLGAVWAYTEIRRAGPVDIYVITLCAGMMGFPSVWGRR